MKKLKLKSIQEMLFNLFTPIRLITLLPIVSLSIVSIFYVGCSKEEPSKSVVKSDIQRTKATDHWIGLCNMANNQIELYKMADADWNVAGTKQWSWKPSTSKGYTTAEVDYWGDPMDVKLRTHTKYGGQVFVTVGGSLATIATYTGGQKKWARNVGYYPHAAELLPNGNIAVAATNSGAGGRVRVYSTTTSNYATFLLNWAHGCLWDPSTNLLWVTGDISGQSVLTALTVGGSVDSPTLSEVGSRRSNAPTGGIHDVFSFFGDANMLLITTNSGTYKYNKTTKAFTALPGSAFRASCKSLANNWPSGQFIEVVSGPQCTLNDWCTATINFYNATTGAWEPSRTINGGAFYKARPWTYNYQE